MRIFTAIRHSKDPSFYYGGHWSGNLYPALKQLGHEIIESQVDLLPASRFMDIADNFTKEEKEVRARTTEQVLAEVHNHHSERPLDVFLSYFYNAHFDPSGVSEIKRLGVPTINFYCNSIYQFELVKDIARVVDYSWHSEKHARDSYLKAGANPVWVQMGADPEVYRPHSDRQRQERACFVGQRYADRDRLAAHLIRRDVPIDLYGTGWAGKLQSGPAANGNNSTSSSPVIDCYLGRRQVRAGSSRSYFNAAMDNVRREGVARGTTRSVRQWAYRNASKRLDSVLKDCARGYASNISETFAEYEVVLNFSNVWADGRPCSELIPHVRLRDFEGPMCRATYLTGWTDEIEEFYEVGKEIDVYRSAEELVEKIAFYLTNHSAAEKLREAGYQRARRDHTWVQRFRELFGKIGLTHAT